LLVRPALSGEEMLSKSYKIFGESLNRKMPDNLEECEAIKLDFGDGIYDTSEESKNPMTETMNLPSSTALKTKCEAAVPCMADESGTSALLL
jgi:hypothetical protein